MKRVVNSKVYDTETAKEIVSWCNGYDEDHPLYCKEILYISPNAQYFMYGTGGRFSKYGHLGKDGGSMFTVFSIKEASTWCEESQVDVDIIKKFFDVEEG